MYVSIDLKGLRFMHKAPSFKTVAHLCYIEARHVPYSIEPIDAKSWLGDLTDMEMKMLYRNTTGNEIHYLGSYLRAILCEIAYRLPETEVNAYEAERQAACLTDESEAGYEYVGGSFTPALNGYLVDPLRAPTAPNEPEIGARGASYYLARVATLHPASAQRATGGQGSSSGSASRAQRPAGAPRSGGNREVIFRVADEIWTNAGQPKEKETVLTLRREIMKVLESEHGVKKTTSSTALGEWQKQRIG